jgi:hypothetical protein
VEASISFETSMNFYQIKRATSQNTAFFKSSSFCLERAPCDGSIHMHRSGDEVRVTARINVPKLRFHFVFVHRGDG